MRNSKKKQLKQVKKHDQVHRKPPPLQLTQPMPRELDHDVLLQTLLSPNTSNLMQGFSRDQKKLISQQFGKMMRTLKKKLKSPDKIENSQRSKLQTKTQRFQYSDYFTSKKNMKKTLTTERKNPRPARNRKNGTNTKETLITSPKKSTRNNSSQVEPFQYRTSTFISPHKANRPSQVKLHLNSNTSPKRKSQQSSRKKTSTNQRQVNGNENYILLGDRFVEVDDEEILEMRQEIIFQQSKMVQRGESEHAQQVWRQFFEEKSKINHRLAQPQEQQETGLDKIIRELDENIKSNNTSQCSSIVQKIIGKSTPKEQEVGTNEQFFQDFYQQSIQINEDPESKTEINGAIDSNFCRNGFKLSGNKNTPNAPTGGSELQSPKSVSYSCESQYIEGSPSPKSPHRASSSFECSIQSRINAIELQLKTSKQILNKLLESGKVDRKTYQANMDKIIKNYDAEMTEVDKFREAIDRNEQKIDRLIRSSNEGLRMSEKLEEVQVQVLLDRVIEGHAVDSHGNNQQNIQSPETKQHQAPKNHALQYQTHFENKPLQITLSQSTKNKIQQRIACQLGMLSPTNQKQCIQTSVLAIYQFIKNFYAFLIKNHLQEFLLYVNMPYGYSVEQRLRYMQGYDDDQQHNEGDKKSQIIYGLEEVIRPALLEQYYRTTKGSLRSKEDNQFVQDTEKLHNRAIFDAINEAINKFRPYYAINGCPYQWTTTEKALTYYFIREDCYEELLEKVQVQVLKCSSCLCGLLIESPAPQSHPCLGTLTIQQIFQKYTMETPNQLLQHREQKIIKSQAQEIELTNFQWHFHDEFKTALLYEVSSCILEDLAHECAMKMQFGCQIEDLMELVQECGLGAGFDTVF